MIESVSDLNLDPIDEEQVKRLIREKTQPLRNSKRVPNPDALDKIEARLAEELKRQIYFIYSFCGKTQLQSLQSKQ